jgi:hypothetical protein
MLNTVTGLIGYEIIKKSKKNRYNFREIYRYRERLALSLAERLNYTVINGPFKGMKLIPGSHWNSGDIASQLFGLYEEELENILEKELSKKPDIVINIGAGDGFYLVGIKRRLSDARAIGYEINELSRQRCMALAAFNSVDIEVHGEMSIDDISLELKDAKNALVFCDVEGAEIAFCEMNMKDACPNATFIIECHDFLVPGVTQALKEKFQETHTVEEIFEGGRNPNKFELLGNLNSFDKSIICCEFRGGPQNWMYATPKNFAPAQDYASPETQRVPLGAT